MNIYYCLPHINMLYLYMYIHISYYILIDKETCMLLMLFFIIVSKYWLIPHKINFLLIEYQCSFSVNNYCYFVFYWFVKEQSADWFVQFFQTMVTNTHTNVLFISLYFRQVTLRVENMIQERNISNIIAVVKGHYESGKITAVISL